jgi:hypothetical protein
LCINLWKIIMHAVGVHTYHFISGMSDKICGDMIEENVKREVHLLKIPPLHFNDILDILWK